MRIFIRINGCNLKQCIDFNGKFFISLSLLPAVRGAYTRCNSIFASTPTFLALF